ncbi:hypothetical protein C7401_11899 [Paraburkholderia unamae]|nr:hypothetical protein C7401_11899 [Paraburkholderia unamae]
MLVARIWGRHAWFTQAPRCAQRSRVIVAHPRPAGLSRHASSLRSNGDISHAGDDTANVSPAMKALSPAALLSRRDPLASVCRPPVRARIRRQVPVRIRLQSPRSRRPLRIEMHDHLVQSFALSRRARARRRRFGGGRVPGSALSRAVEIVLRSLLHRCALHRHTRPSSDCVSALPHFGTLERHGLAVRVEHRDRR